MKLYKEMMRKLAVVGLPLLAVTLVYTLVTGGQVCFGQVVAKEAVSAVFLVPVLQYYVFSAIIFAFYGFSFLFSRAGSDVYHSLPVKRTELYVSVLLATATWMGATILLNVLEMLVMLLISGCPFVPVYVPLTILFSFVASMLVFSAAAVGCALSGTILSALASTGIVLLLPRFLQFLFARGIVERVPIIGWLDFGALLDPTTNVATGILVMHLRGVYASRLITLPHILYSLLPTLVMLGAGLWLFMRRPSEMAQKNGGSRIWTVVTAILLSFAVMLPITMNRQSIFSVYGGVLTAAALAVFFVYQLIVSPKLKQALKTLPCFLLAVLPMLGISLLIDTAADSMLNVAPAVAEVESVTFRGYDSKSGDPVYSTLLIDGIAFTDAETKQYVSQALSEAVEKLRTEPEYRYYDYNQFKVIEPVTIKLSGGGTVKRTIEFMNIDGLNELRMQNEAFAAAVKELPPTESVQYILVDQDFSKEQNQAILESYVAEAKANDLLNGYYYQKRTVDMLPNGSYAVQGKNQSLTNMITSGYIGGERYHNANSLRLEAPETVSLLMRTYNAIVDEDPVGQIAVLLNQFGKGEAAENDSLSFNLTVYNYLNEDGLTVQEAVNFYVNNYTLSSDYPYDKLQLEFMNRFMDMLPRASMTDDPNGVFIRLNWSYYDSTIPRRDAERRFPAVFLRFEDAADEGEFLNLMREWEAAQHMM